jgi:hypothetical protein
MTKIPQKSSCVGMFTWAETEPVRRQRGRTGDGSGISNMSLNQVPRGFDGAGYNDTRGRAHVKGDMKGGV